MGKGDRTSDIKLQKLAQRQVKPNSQAWEEGEMFPISDELRTISDRNFSASSEVGRFLVSLVSWNYRILAQLLERLLLWLVLEILFKKRFIWALV